MPHHVRLLKGEYGIQDLRSWLRKCTQDSKSQFRSDLRKEQALFVTTFRDKANASDHVTSHSIRHFSWIL